MRVLWALEEVGTIPDEGRAFRWSVWMTELEEPIITALKDRAFLPEPQREPTKADAQAR